ncbi:LOW QUALITY PROTEIN: hypothetical protein HID58_005966 [Brassica napus]|uniref:Transposase-associated domain-containing protein n=1 Tax=Brassica napus TaxID=3708 RepID=A0ABQ8EA66_BRANA|nr:LOW QUALITY PROTEIN: hypothetical protein HID58_005966 [Brassica napus]
MNSIVLMDKSWVNKPRLSQDYRLGVKIFLDFAFGKSNAPMVKCPCTCCSLAKSKTREDIEGDLICHGFLSSYTSWIVHGEDMCVTENARVPSDSAHVELDSTFNLLDDIFPDISANMNEEHEEGSPGQPMDTDRPSASKTQEPDDLPYLETEYDMPPPLAAEYKSFKWKIEVIDTAGKIEGKMITSKEVWKIQNSKVIVHFDEVSGQPIGESGGLLGSWLGQLSNDVNLLPINYSDWRMSKFWFDDPATRKVFVMSALGSRCKDVKLRLWKEYKRDSLSETLLNRPENVHENQWGHFVHMRFKIDQKMFLKINVEKLTTLLGQKSHVTNNAIASLDDEYAQVFGPERPGRVRCVGRGPTPSKLVNHSPVTRQEIENSEMVIDLKSQVKELSDQVKGMTTFIQQVIGTSTGEQARVWASSFAVAFANIPNPAFANVPSPPNPNQERSDDATKTQTLEAMAVIFINIIYFIFMNLHDGLVDLISNTLFII